MSRKQTRKRRKKPIPPRRSPLALVLILLCGAILGALASSGAPRALASLWPTADALPSLRISAPEWPSIDASLRRPGLALRKVEFMGLKRLSPESLWQQTGVSGAVHLIDLRPKQICEQLSELPRVRSCAASRVPPSSLLIEIEERVALAQLENTNLGVDADEQTFELLPEETGLPLLRGDIPAALPLIAAAQSLSEPLEIVIAESNRAIWFVPPGEPIRVRLGEPPNHSLQIWRRLRQSGVLERPIATRAAQAGGKGELEIDLRFEGNAVLRDF